MSRNRFVVAGERPQPGVSPGSGVRQDFRFANYQLALAKYNDLVRARWYRVSLGQLW